VRAVRTEKPVEDRRKSRRAAAALPRSDVISAVNFGREHKLRIAVRGGGHNAGGLGV
jgi:hypothetical protein